MDCAIQGLWLSKLGSLSRLSCGRFHPKERWGTAGAAHRGFRALGSVTITASPAAPGSGGSWCFPGCREAPRCSGPCRRRCSLPRRSAAGPGPGPDREQPLPRRLQPPTCASRRPTAPARIPPTFPGEGREGGRGRGMAVPQGTAGGEGWVPPGGRRGRCGRCLCPWGGDGRRHLSSPERRGLPGPVPSRWRQPRKGVGGGRRGKQLLLLDQRLVYSPSPSAGFSD